MIRLAAISLFSLSVAYGAAVPAGTELSVRLLDRVSSSDAVKKPVRAVLIAPILVDGAIAIPAGTELTGEVKQVKPPATGEQAQLDVAFTQARQGKAHTAIQAVVAGVDNAREQVDAKGTILGILGSETLTSRIDQGISKLSQNSKFGALAGMIEGAKQQFGIQEADPNITYEPGTEMTLRLTQPFSSTGTDQGAFAKLQPVEHEDELIDLVNRQPFRTVAERPPRPSDITNIMFIGTEDDLRDAFEKAGWSTAAKLSAESKLETARAIIEGRGYKEGPMSVLLLEGRPPDMVYQKANNTYAQRHHLRIFRRPGTFSGKPIWVCSATHDIAIDFSQNDRTFIHKIDPDIDKERAKVVNDLVYTGRVRALALVDRPAIPKDATNATGDPLQTDGKMAVLLLQ